MKEKENLTEETTNEETINEVEVDTTETAPAEENFLDSINELDEELVDLTSEKLDELNKKLPSWSIEPPHKFLK